jgi:hypothetical protein
LKQGDEYVSEWTGEITGEEEIGAAIGKTIAGYRKSSGRAIWGMTIMIDKRRRSGEAVCDCRLGLSAKQNPHRAAVRSDRPEGQRSGRLG